MSRPSPMFGEECVMGSDYVGELVARVRIRRQEEQLEALKHELAWRKRSSRELEEGAARKLPLGTALTLPSATACLLPLAPGTTGSEHLLACRSGRPSRLLGFPWQGGQSVECRHKAPLIERCPVFEDVIDLCGDDTLDEDIGIEGLLVGKQSTESAASFERWLQRRKAI